MAQKQINPYPRAGMFSQRVSAPIGGNQRSGPFHEFPMDRAATARKFYEHFNDFDKMGDFDTDNFQWNRTDGSASAYGAGTAVARIADWLPSLIGGASTAVAPSLTAASLISDTANGVLRLDAGTTDSTGVAVTRVRSGTSIGQPFSVAVQPTTYGTTAALRSPNRVLVFGARFTINETGTANQSAASIIMARDETAVLTTGGAISGTNGGQFGFHKPLASAGIVFYCRNSISSVLTTTVATLTPGTMVECTAVITKRSSLNFVADLYANGVYVQTFQDTTSSHIPTDDNYGPSLALVNGVGADCTMDVDYYFGITERL